jgi:CrcB protein
MSALVVVAVAAVGGLGAVARLVLDGAVSARVGRTFPFGTLAVNIIGAFALGLVAALALSRSGYDIVATGLIGAFTTFSTWSLESQRLGEDGQLRLGALNFAASLVLGVAAAWAGRRLGVAL